MADGMDRVLAGALGALERQLEAEVAQTAEFGRLVGRFPGGRTFVRAGEDGRPVSSMVIDPAPNGDRVVYELVGVDARDLI